MESSLNEFLTTWRKRKEGKLPMADLRVSCSKCGKEIQGDDRVEFTREGLVCVCCFKGRDGTTAVKQS